MEDQIARLYRWWHKLGGRVLLSRPDKSKRAPVPEKVILATTAWARHDGRLSWILIEWLARNPEKIRYERVIRGLKNTGDEAVLGVLCEAAYRRNPHPGLKAIFAQCEPQRPAEFFFFRVKLGSLRARIVRKNGLALFRKWGFWCDELDYLDKAAPGSGRVFDAGAAIAAIVPSKTRNGILRYLVAHGRARVQETMKAEGLSYMPAYTELQRFAKAGVVTAEQVGKTLVYTLNPSSPVYRGLKFLFEPLV